MKILYIIAILTLLLSCAGEKTSSPTEKETNSRIIEPVFQSIIDSANIEGSVLIYDFQKKNYYSNNFEWAETGHLPASTFKIVNSIIALETGVIENDSTLMKWDGEKRNMKIWEQDLLFRDAFHFSCVPCYQEIAREIGAKRMNEYLKKYNYGDMKVDANSIDVFWLEGESKINQFQQIDFLRQFYQSELPIAKRTEEIMKRLMVIEEIGNYKLSGKTGWSIRNENNNGWFVGYIESKYNLYFFATNVEPQDQFNIDMFPMIRKEISYKVFRQLEIIE